MSIARPAAIATLMTKAAGPMLPSAGSTSVAARAA
jgi:hypothetical protein